MIFNISHSETLSEFEKKREHVFVLYLESYILAWLHFVIFLCDIFY